MAEKRSVEARTVVRSVTVGVPDTTVEDFTEVATLVGAPTDARISTNGGSFYNPATGTSDTQYPYSVTFTWTDSV